MGHWFEQFDQIEALFSWEYPAVREAQNEGFVVVAVEDDVSNDGCHIALQGAAATPSITGTTLVVTFG